MVFNGAPVFGFDCSLSTHAASSFAWPPGRPPEKLLTAASYRSFAMAGISDANSHIFRNEGIFAAGVSGFAPSSSLPNRCSLTMSKALTSLPEQGSVAWWLYRNFPPS